MYSVQHEPDKKQELGSTYLALKRQSRWSAFAAISAFVATGMQALSLVLAAVSMSRA